MDKLVAGEPLISGNITEEKNTREGAQIPNVGAFVPEWIQGDWEAEGSLGLLAFTITPNEVRYLWAGGSIGHYKDKLMEEQGFTMEYFVKGTSKRHSMSLKLEPITNMCHFCVLPKRKMALFYLFRV